MAPACGSRSNAAVPVYPTRLTSHGLDRCIDAYDAAGQGNFERALRFGLNQPRERPYLSLTALARVERSAGYIILTGMAAMHHDLAVRAADDVCYTQILNPV